MLSNFDASLSHTALIFSSTSGVIGRCSLLGGFLQVYSRLAPFITRQVCRNLQVPHCRQIGFDSARGKPVLRSETGNSPGFLLIRHQLVLIVVSDPVIWDAIRENWKSAFKKARHLTRCIISGSRQLLLFKVSTTAELSQRTKTVWPAHLLPHTRTIGINSFTDMCAC